MHDSFKDKFFNVTTKKSKLKIAFESQKKPVQ